MENQINAVSLICFITNGISVQYAGSYQKMLPRHLFPVTSHLDYTNALLYDLPNVTIGHLQRVQNAAASNFTYTQKASLAPCGTEH